MRLVELRAIAILGVMLAQTVHVRTADAQGGNPAVHAQAATPGPLAAKPSAAPPPGLASIGAPAPEPNTISGPVDINAASAAELGKVRFIGRKRAAAIVSGRPWHSPEDLVTKKIMPRKVYDQIKDQLFVK